MRHHFLDRQDVDQAVPSNDHRRFGRDALMIEQYPVGHVQPVALAVIHGHPVAEHLRDPVGRARMEGRALRLRSLLHEAVHLGASCLVHADRQVQLPHRVEQAQHAQAGDVGRVLGHFEGDLDVALGGEVVDLLRLDRLQGPGEAVLVHEVAVVQGEAVPDVVDAPGVERAAAPDETVDLVPLLEEQLRQVAAVLAGDSRDESLRRQSTSPRQKGNLQRRCGGGQRRARRAAGGSERERKRKRKRKRKRDRVFPDSTLAPRRSPTGRSTGRSRDSRRGSLQTPPFTAEGPDAPAIRCPATRSLVRPD
jgi:hypothetical protein